MAKALLSLTLVVLFVSFVAAVINEGDPCSAADPNYYGFYAPHPIYCYRYLQCARGVMISRNCSPGLFWNRKEGVYGICDWPANVQCDGATTQRSTTQATTTPGTTITHSYTSTTTEAYEPTSGYYESTYYTQDAEE